MIDKIVRREVEHYKKLYTDEKASLTRKWKDEMKMRDHHIELLNESVRSQEIENKKLIEIIYTKEKEIDGSQKDLTEVIVTLRRDNKNLHKRIKAIEQDYEYMISNRNEQISYLNEALKAYQVSDMQRREKMKSMSEIRTSRLDYSQRRESLIPEEDTFHVSRGSKYCDSKID